MNEVFRSHRRRTQTALGIGVLGLGGWLLLGGVGGDSPEDEAAAAGTSWTAGQLPAAAPVPVPAAPTPTPPTTAAAPVTTPPPTAAKPPVPPPVARPAPVARRAPVAVAAPTTSPLASAWISAGAKGVAADAAAASPAPAGARAPVQVEIPSIGVSAPVDPAGLNGDGTMQTPEDFSRTNWYTGLPVPGDVGPAVIVGHVDNRRGPAVFYRLRELGPGDEVIVRRADGAPVVFVVERSKQVPKPAFPTEEVYGPTPDAQLRLVTCGGSFDRSTRHYRDNIIVFLRMKA